MRDFRFDFYGRRHCTCLDSIHRAAEFMNRLFHAKIQFCGSQSSAVSMEQITTYLSPPALIALFSVDMPLDRFVPVEIVWHNQGWALKLFPFMSTPRSIYARITASDTWNKNILRKEIEITLTMYWLVFDLAFCVRTIWRYCNDYPTIQTDSNRHTSGIYHIERNV